MNGPRVPHQSNRGEVRRLRGENGTGSEIARQPISDWSLEKLAPKFPLAEAVRDSQP
jgi:hypothetical protein